MRDLRVGFQYLVQGQRWVARHGKQYGFGLIPGLITLVLYIAALVALAVWGPDFVTWATPFADDWSSPWPGLFRGLLTAVLFALALALAVITFTAVTLLIGQPFYENLSEKVDRDVSPDGTAPESHLPLWQELWISARDSLRILARALVWAILLFALGFVPFVGQTVVPVVGFFVTGFFLTEELTAVALQRRRVELRDRLALLRSRRTLIWGFGTPLGLAFLVPFVAVFLMPGAVAGATLMARDLLGEETTGEDERGRVPGDGHPAPPMFRKPEVGA
ncbi:MULTISPECIES: EI24 domain-containing protein [Streptomyces]|uniref:EI24 domain-containing protein n=1 Tax=Streptomyces caniscabiei TaxID=2746961 RepID=A0ABU4MP42_9ACTN|nr:MULTISPECIES: EI24 domain-containing protein [Streptomyces]MBE4737911.1 EI24 domain-containing protein [Streptomyces caniscabiei]MBE4757290.1 EI24 domain-containing protein [Streptomyces caniscabiei]MBE4769289.1 EI24 domain-containing protein [Streptomyces caniscabiei]MBE4784990.1 EI24 domain-containing protein [Streptomyces caniscabiei]MBE4795774.1 EI24 domain-containing protein [Streptomyces caniscabiei]